MFQIKDYICIFIIVFVSWFMLSGLINYCFRQSKDLIDYWYKRREQYFNDCISKGIDDKEIRKYN